MARRSSLSRQQVISEANDITIAEKFYCNAPSLIFPRELISYTGYWNGPNDYYGFLKFKNRAGLIEYVNLQKLFEGEWDGQVPSHSMLSPAIGLWGAAASKRVVMPGSQTWAASGSLLVPWYDQIEAISVGGGGGGGAADDSGNPDPGDTGGQSSFSTSTPLLGNGGVGGARGLNGNGSGGAGGTASGGTTNSTGTTGSGASGSSAKTSGAGANRASYTGTLLTYTQRNGGGSRTNVSSGTTGAAGGAGASGANAEPNGAGGGGGAGGLAARLWSLGDSGAPAELSTVSVTVGSGGSRGQHDDDGQNGGTGGRGEVQVAWA